MEIQKVSKEQFKRYLAMFLALVMLFSSIGSGQGSLNISAATDNVTSGNVTDGNISDGNLIESDHPYSNNCDKTWEVTEQGAKRIAITFSEDTCVENNWDYIYIYDGDDNQIGKYTGGTLAGKRIVVSTDTVKIRLTSDSSNIEYGFRLTNVEIFYEDCIHTTTEVINRKSPTCTEAGYTGDTYCYDCELIFEYGEEIPSLGGSHMYEDDICKNCGDLIWKYEINDNSVTITGCEEAEGDLMIPAEIEGYPVRIIAEEAFSGCIGLSNIEIPDSVTSIGSFAFYECSGLKSVTIPDSVTYIGAGAFECCDGLTSMMIPDSVTYIGNFAFERCSELKQIIVSASNTEYLSIDGVLYNKSAEKLICYPGGRQGAFVIPDSVTSIAPCAFADCEGLTSVTIPDSVTEIGMQAFFSCGGLTSVTIPDSVTYIGNYAFARCEGLTSVTIPDSVTNIGAGVFECCSGLNEIIVSSSNTKYMSIDGVLYNKSAEKLICYPGGRQGAFVIPDSVTSIGYNAFFECRGLTSVTIPDSVTNIELQAFYFCDGLTSVTIPDSVTNIETGVFACCYRLTSVTIPDSLTSIGAYAFDGCNSITDVYFGGSEESWNKIIIDYENDCLTNATIYYNCTLVVDEDSYLLINSERNLVNNISTGITVADITSQFISSEEIGVIDTNGVELDFDDVIGTGCKVQRIINGMVVDELTTVITGDTDGDGAVTVADTQIAYNHLMGTAPVSGAYAEAAKANGGNAMSILDVMAMLKMI